MRSPESLRTHVAARIAAHGVQGPVVVGVSGGMDSAVLLDALVRTGTVAVIGVHVHHGLRGADADADAAHAEALCAAHGVPFVLHRATDPPTANRQAWGRALRARVFAGTARSHGATWVATAHHADDQAETFLLALLRGAGARGLSGMSEARRLAPGVQLLRPLLALPRAALHAYAGAEGLRWREDDSNADPHYRRAALRHDVLPRLEALVPGATAHLAQAAAYVQAERQMAAPAWRRLLGAALADTTHGGRVRAAALDGLPEAVRTGVLLEAARRYLPGTPTARTARRLDALLTAPVGRRLRRAGQTVWRTRAGLAFAPDPAPTDPGMVTQVLDAGGLVRLPDGWLWLGDVPHPGVFLRDPHAAYFDADTLVLPLTVRRWRPGDHIVPFGSRTPRRVSDLLTNARLEPDIRARTCVALDAAGQIVAVVGLRAAQVAPVGAHTARLRCLRFVPDPPA